VFKYKAAFSVAYGAGLRVSEVAHLKVSDVDSKRMVLRIEQRKGKKDRLAMLSPRLLQLLRDYWWVAKPRTWLFRLMPPPWRSRPGWVEVLGVGSNGEHGVRGGFEQ
jgi:integrase/recombinase XerD